MSSQERLRRTLKKYARDTSRRKSFLNVDLNAPPPTSETPSPEGTSVPPLTLLGTSVPPPLPPPPPPPTPAAANAGVAASPINVEAIEDEDVQLLSSLRALPQARNWSRRSQPVTVVLDEVMELSTGTSGPEEEQLPTIPTDDRPLRWLEESGIAMIKRFHKRPTQAMGGKLSNFPLQVGDAVRSNSDTSVRHSWPRDEVTHRVMEQALDSFNSTYYLSQLFMRHMLDIKAFQKDKAKLIEKVTVTDNLRVALEKRAASQEVDITRLSDLVSTLTNERDQSRQEVLLLKGQLKKEAGEAKSMAEAAAQKEIDSLKNTVIGLRTMCNDDIKSLIASEKKARAAEAKAKAAEDKVDSQGKEILSLNMKLDDPRALRRLYEKTVEHDAEMNHYISEGFEMTMAYLLREVVKDGQSIEEVRQILNDLEYNTVVDSDLAEGEGGENLT